MYLRDWDLKPLRVDFDGYSMSLDLRFYYKTLFNLVESTAGWKLAFITVNFSDEVTNRIACAAARAAATYYADLINKRLRKRGVDAQWFCVLEDHEGNLHSHCLVAYHEDDESAIRDCFKQDKAPTASGYRVQFSYKQRIRTWTKPSIKRQVFTNADGLRKFRLAPIDIGIADYMSKTLDKPSRYMDPGRGRIYASRGIRGQAKKLYTAARTRQQRLRSNKVDLSQLTLHQSMTYLYRGWIPAKIDPEDDLRYELQASEIDDLMAWGDFRNSSPAYDWQYEEGDADLNDYLAAQRDLAADPSERDYERAVLAAEAAWDKELKSAEPSEYEYDQNVSESILQARQQWEAQQLSEADYDRLMLEVDALHGLYPRHSPLPDDFDVDMPDDEAVTFIRQEGLSELCELISEHAGELMTTPIVPIWNDIAWQPCAADMTSALTVAESAQQPESIGVAATSKEELTASPTLSSSSLQNARKRPCERRGRRGIARHYSNVRTPLGRSPTRYSARQVRQSELTHQINFSPPLLLLMPLPA